MTEFFKALELPSESWAFLQALTAIAFHQQSTEVRVTDLQFHQQYALEKPLSPKSVSNKMGYERRKLKIYFQNHPIPFLIILPGTRKLDGSYIPTAYLLHYLPVLAEIESSLPLNASRQRIRQAVAKTLQQIGWTVKAISALSPAKPPAPQLQKLTTTLKRQLAKLAQEPDADRVLAELLHYYQYHRACVTQDVVD